MTKEELHQIGILEICQRIHMNKTGAGMEDPKDIKSYIEYLNKKLDEWTTNIRTLEYDQRIKDLIKTVLNERNYRK